MQPGIRPLVEDLVVVGAAAMDAAEASDWSALREAARRALSAASKLHSRAMLLEELMDDAKFIAEVDRALTREKQSRGAGPIPGDTPLPFTPPGTPGRAGKTSPRPRKKG